MATILLVSFAVAVGGVVMSMGRAQAQDAAECPLEVGLSFSEIGGKQQLCYDGASLKFTIENGITLNVEGLVVNIIGAEKAETFDIADAKMSKAGTYVGKLAFDKAISGIIRQVKISPKVSLKGEEAICPDKALIVESVGTC